MKAVPTSIGGIEVLIEANDEHLEVLGSRTNSRQTVPTGVEDKATAAYADVKKVIQQMASDFSTDLAAMVDAVRPSKMEMEIGLAFSASAGVWMFTAKGEGSIKVKFHWDLERNGQAKAN